ncbi:MAG: hypothetical protein AMJ81_00455 [Phycisphaerae bacterium SM23_33]|nr:MAG: hypothetical protein AMJ81_00455 [Phycisphaerae bacterium SM23_33]
MKKHRVKMLAPMYIGMAASLAGCWQMPPGSSPQPVPPPAPPKQADHLGQASIEYEPEPAVKVDDTVKTALMWADKAKQAMDTVVRLQADNRGLEDRNKRLLEQVAGLQGELAQAQKELRDANELLLEMRQDLDRWKTNVLGFREELRAAHQAQLEAMRQVIILLGGQPVAQPAQKESAKTNKTAGEPGA